MFGRVYHIIHAPGCNRRRKNYREHKNYLEMSYADDFWLRKHFRFDRKSIYKICEILEDQYMEPVTEKGLPIGLEIQVLTTLLYLSHHTHQVWVARAMGISQTSVSICVRNVCRALAAKANDFIRFPATPEEISAVKRGFYEMAKFPGVFGCVDCTHIKIRKPPKEIETAYYSRKKTHSLNVQAVCDDRIKFTNIVARWPGSCHDAGILQVTELWDVFEAGRINGLLLGDSGYPCRAWLMTPFLNAATPAQERYNQSLRRTRQCIERAFGCLKKRWGILQGVVRVKREMIPTVIVACAVLHNLSIDFAQFDPEEEEDEEIRPVPLVQIIAASKIAGKSAGQIQRQRIVDRHFS